MATQGRSGSRFNKGGGTTASAFDAQSNSKLTPQEREIIDVSFEAFKDDDAFITTQRLKEAFATIGALGDVNDDDMKMLMDDIDENGDGRIDEEEFRSIMTRKFLGEDDDSSFVHAFEMLDADKDGYIPLAELREVLMREGDNPLTEQEVDELMMFADIEGDGLIEYKSFLRWLINPDGPQPPRF